MNTLKIAIPNKGRLREPSLALLRAAGIEIEESNGSLFVKSADGSCTILFARADDVPKYVESGAADCGITGSDMIAEAGAKVQQLCPLGFGKCRISLASKKGATLQSLGGKTIATRLPKIASSFFASKRMSVKILKVAGATELTPYLGIADAIIDQVSTGSTLALNNLCELEKIMDSQAVLICSDASRQKTEELALSIKGVLLAEEKAYLMLNVQEKNLEAVANLLGGMKSPTMMPLAAKGMFALHSVVQRRGINSLIYNLKQAGASDILLLDIERIVK
ncbi:ATP phosphoribosyltransferase [Candidatus Anstonella stagnisolia]|nr:ATP phosphoribosyltransferase [Candidatus Anstonella stagnisolia]